MLKIGDFSKLSRISIRMLRYYDENGVLSPKQTDGFTGYRYYGEDQLPIAGRITALKDMGFGISAIGSILSNCRDAAALQSFLEVKRAELAAEKEAISGRLLLLDTAIKQFRKEGSIMKYSVTLKELPARQVASVRQIIPAYDQEQLLWNILMKETAHMKLQPGDPCYTLAIFHDGEYKEGEVDVEVQKTVKGDYSGTEHVVFKTEPPVLIASATYKGSYESITEANQAVARWIRDNGYDFNGLSFCIYHVSPYDTKNPEEFVTEVCFPVKKRI